MGNDHSTQHGSRGDGVPFVCWKDGGCHFAEPSCYKYDKAPPLVSANVVLADPPKADSELINRQALLGNIALVERGGRVHFPDIIRRVLSAGAIGCIFIERVDNKAATQSLFDGFHSSGRQSVPIPIVLLSKFHADQLLEQKPARVSIELLSGEQAIKHIVPDDIYFAIATAARAGELDLLKHLLYADTTGSVLTQIPKAVALCDAAENGNVDCIEVLHGFGISLDEQKPNGTSALMVACSVGNVEAARALLMYGASVDLEDVHGFTALMITARDGKVPCLKLLIRKGARINLSRNRNRGTTALHIAARGGLEEVCSVLLEAGAALDIQSPNSTTALMEAARAGNLGCVRLLVGAGASLDAKDREGHTAEELARLSEHHEIEDFLRERAESESVKDHRRKVEETVAQADSTLEDLLRLAEEDKMSVDILRREITRDTKYCTWLEQPHVVYEVFRLITKPIQESEPMDPIYGHYKIQQFCCEIALWYSRRIFQKPRSVGFHSTEEFDLERSSGYLKVLFNFLCHSGQLDDVLLVLFCKVMNHYILNQQMGGLIWSFLADEGKFTVPWIVAHIGSDSIRDMVVWLLYSDMTEEGQYNIRRSGIFDQMFGRLYSWQRTLSWGVGTPFQRDSIENICSVINYIIYPPSVYIMGNVATFVENTDHSLPLITDQYYPNRHNELFKTLLFFWRSTDVTFGTLLDLGFAEIYRQASQDCNLIVHEGGALSIAMMIMSTLGYHKRKRDTSGIEYLLKDMSKILLNSAVTRVERFVKLCEAVVESDANKLRQLASEGDRAVEVIKAKGSALLYIITFLKRCVFLQNARLNSLLAHAGLMPCLLACYGSHPKNSLLHHEVTDVIRFVLLDPDQKRLPSCPLLNSLFIEGANILDFVIKSYDSKFQYKGHMTTIANSIFTLVNTPVYKSDAAAITCQEIVRQYTSEHEEWRKFEARLAQQNEMEMQPLGQRNAPLCDGCLKLKEDAVDYVTSTLTSEVRCSGYLETIFYGAASHHCKVNYTDDYITGFLYKKDKIHDHIPIPEPTRVSSFIQFPVPMPFHALTFTVTFFGLCKKCDKLWYCDTLQSANWPTRMKWVMPTSVRKWYSFGASEGPGSGAHGIQFSTKGYKNFIVLTDTWGRQEQWMHAMEEAIMGLSTHAARRIDAASALAIEIDNEVDADHFNMKSVSDAQKGSGSESDSEDEDLSPNRRRSNTISSSVSETEKTYMEFSSDEEEESDRRARSNMKMDSGTRAATEASLRSGNPLPAKLLSPPRGVNVIRRTGSDKHRNLDLKKFQPDSEKFNEVLNRLRIASPPRVNAATTTNRALNPRAVHATANFTTTAASLLRPTDLSNAGDGGGMRHVFSTPDLTKAT
ncbi:TPA: hypothetical protein N0F65_010539 [Lagenidium giganteum]|uniref:PA domain-containing protein n=1 Tax=Lagenidium giganteum TaxID=4803 RepID=A0AAV2ZBG3_9STRA|nr:TPA: hypothetical protein N0F65_010539 [Lagenidium giganteum]